MRSFYSTAKTFSLLVTLAFLALSFLRFLFGNGVLG